MCFIINSESSSKRFLSVLLRTISDLFMSKMIGIPQLILSKPSFKGNSIFRSFDSSEIISFFKVFSSSSNCGSSYNFKYSTTIFMYKLNQYN